LSKTKHKTTRAVFIIGIIFDNLTIFQRLSHFLYTDPPQNAVINRMAREFKLPGSNFTAYVLDHFGFFLPKQYQRVEIA